MSIFKYKRLKATLFVCLFLLFTMAFAYITPFFAQSQAIAEDVLRLHIIANSDSETDQALKYTVRDAVLRSMQDKFLGADTLEETVRIAQENRQSMQDTANAVLAQNGAAYAAQVTIDREYFNTRAYEEVTFPAGCYASVVITLGEGGGKNWWCVMYPAICLPEVQEDDLDTVLNDDEMTVIESDKYDVRFKIVEIYQEIVSFFQEKTMHKK